MRNKSKGRWMMTLDVHKMLLDLGFNCSAGPCCCCCCCIGFDNPGATGQARRLCCQFFLFCCRQPGWKALEGEVTVGPPSFAGQPAGWAASALYLTGGRRRSFLLPQPPTPLGLRHCRRLWWCRRRRTRRPAGRSVVRRPSYDLPQRDTFCLFHEIFLFEK